VSFSPKKLSNLPVYQDESGWWVRPTLKGGKRVWRKLSAGDLPGAVVEAVEKNEKHERFLSGKGDSSPYEESKVTFASLAAEYLKAGCPNSRGERREEGFCLEEEERVKSLIRYFGEKHPNEIRLRDLPAHAVWRRKLCERGSGARTVELDWVTLSNVQRFGIGSGAVEFAWVGRDRPRLRGDNLGSISAEKIRHAREVAPRSPEEVHLVARWLLERWPSSGWFWLFACLAGLRKNELLLLRTDASSPKDPGFSDDRFLYVRRSKRALKHTVLLFPELEALLEAHFDWHQRVAPSNPFFFPGEGDGHPIEESVPGKGIKAACEALGLPHFTPHGGRAFCATVWRSHRLTEAEVASRIGDRTVKLIADVYGNDPFDEKEPIRWTPSLGTPAWSVTLASPPPMEVPK
jgi:integrase